ncbi:RxLR effector protein [Phytophthora megakarya]|uniref:RxLR effector protein n=1 Tax=Phytophthora megakarya TaxID=4795 RepID=A0A225V0I1_9STRA|nr:RxLR effector protein [Phytophthora megakarya]
MHWQWLVALVVISTKTSLHAAFIPTQSQTTNRQDELTDRRLRIYKSENTQAQQVETNHAEERGPSIPAVGTLTNALKATDDIDDWISKGASTDDVFKLLALDKASDDLLANPTLKTWINYMNRFNEGNQEQKTSVIATLTAYYGDVGLAKIIEAAKQVKGTAVMAKRLQNEQIHSWLIAKKSPKDVFTLLNLDEAGSDLFKQPQVVTWAAYLDKFNLENPASKTTLFSFVNPRFEDEGVLVGMLIAAEKVPTTKSIAVRIQAEQTRLWLSNSFDEAKKPAEVFKLLRLDNAGPSLFMNPLFPAWIKYTDDFRRIHYGNTLTTISVLRTYYSDAYLSMMILGAIQSPSMSGMANRLFAEQLRNWEINNFTPERVFKLLLLDKVDEGAGTLFDRPLYTVWASFMGYHGNLRKKEDVSQLAVLLKIYKEQELSAILVKAYNGNSPRTKDIARTLMIGQLHRWLLDRKLPEEVFLLLKVKGAPLDDVRYKVYKSYSAKAKTEKESTG